MIAQILDQYGNVINGYSPIYSLQIILKGNGHEKPAFLITNDFKSPAELIVADYSCRWHVETGISEADYFMAVDSATRGYQSQLNRLIDSPTRK